MRGGGSRRNNPVFRTDANGNIKDNLIIKGNNLLALHSLKKRFAGKVKLIYIDPPYNTPGDANTFNYNNSFNHSTWLIFMKNRLWVSKDLLRNDGVIAITIDDTEQAYLKILCDEVFDRQNFVGTLVIQSKPGGRTNDTYLATSHEYVLFYSKVKDAPQINFFELSEVQKRKYKHGKGENSYKWRDFLRTGGYSTPEERPNSHYPIYYHSKRNHISLEKLDDEYIEILPIDSSGRERVWRKIPSSLQKHIEQGEIKIIKTKNGEWKVKIIDKIKEGIRPSSVWVESRYDASTHGTKLLKRMFDGKKVFSFPKSIYAVQDVIEMFTERGGDDIVLDYFAGSGTTAHAVLELNKQDDGNRQFILCEQMDYTESATLKRTQKVIGNNDFVYLALMKWNENFVMKIQKAKTKEGLERLWETMKKKAFLSYKVDVKAVDKNTKGFAGLSIEDQKKLLLECLDKNHLYVNCSEIEDEEYGVSKEDKKLNREFYKD
ncbi:MAG: site-specific DNA-methyltransferase [bacterium]